MAASYLGFGQDDSGGQAQPGAQNATIVWATTTATVIVPTSALKGPTNAGIIYTGGSGGATSGFGQIFPTGRA